MVETAWAAGASWIRLRTDERNLRSAAAIRKLGAVPDGDFLEDIIRPDGTRRTSHLFRLERSASAPTKPVLVSMPGWDED